MKKKALQELNTLVFANKKKSHSSVPEKWLVVPNLKDSTANGLQTCIITFLNLKGHFAERISNQGRVIDGRKKFVDVLGHTREVGSITRIKSSGTNGTADVSATINGQSVKIEVKIGRDVQSNDQRRYQQSIEAAGGVYVIATDFESFYSWYMGFVCDGAIKESGGNAA